MASNEEKEEKPLDRKDKIITAGKNKNTMQEKQILKQEHEKKKIQERAVRRNRKVVASPQTD